MTPKMLVVFSIALIVITCLQQIVDALSKILHAIAPHTKTKLDDKAAARLDALEADLKELRSMLPTPTPSTARKSEAGCARPHALLVVALVAFLAVGISAISGCSWWATRGKPATLAGAKAATSCALDDIAKYGSAVASDLGTDGYSGAIDKLKADYSLTQDAINCVVQAVIAAMATPPNGSASHGELPLQVIRGRVYLAEHGLITTGATVPQ